MGFLGTGSSDYLQFLVEAVLLSLLGGVLGVALGIGVTVGYAHVQDIVLSVPVVAIWCDFWNFLTASASSLS